jgi:hypothetical protein
LNPLCNSLAKEALVAVIVNKDFTDNTFPFEDVIFQNKTVVGSITNAIYQCWGYQPTRTFFHSKKILHGPHVDLICWECTVKAMRSFPAMFCKRRTKHMDSTAATHIFLTTPRS